MRLRPPTSLALRTLAMTVIAMPGISADWRPPQEPERWALIRRTLQGAGRIDNADWVFFGSLETDTTQAAEYLRNLRPQTQGGDGVVFDGLLLLKRTEDSDWRVRPLTMRALCGDQRLQRLGTDGRWSDYSGRQGTDVKVGWICRTAQER